MIKKLDDYNYRTIHGQIKYWNMVKAFQEIFEDNWLQEIFLETHFVYDQK